MRSPIEIYTVRPGQQFHCDRCGWPVDSGDRAADLGEGSLLFCSGSCARREWRLGLSEAERADILGLENPNPRAMQECS